MSVSLAVFYFQPAGLQSWVYPRCRNVLFQLIRQVTYWSISQPIHQQNDLLINKLTLTNGTTYPSTSKIPQQNSHANVNFWPIHQLALMGVSLRWVSANLQPHGLRLRKRSYLTINLHLCAQIHTKFRRLRQALPFPQAIVAACLYWWIGQFMDGSS